MQDGRCPWGPDHRIFSYKLRRPQLRATSGHLSGDDAQGKNLRGKSSNSKDNSTVTIKKMIKLEMRRGLWWSSSKGS